MITELLNNKAQYHWLPTSLTETNKDYKDLYDYLTGKLDIEVMRPENMRNYINNNPDFLRHRTDDWLVKMYLLYENVGGAFSKHKGESNMLTANFIKTSVGTFVAPYRKSGKNNNYEYSHYLSRYTNATYLPNVFLPSKNAFQIPDIPLVDKNIYSRCQHFFEEILELPEPNEYEFFVRDFEKRYKSKKSISDNQHIRDINQLLKYINNDDYRNEVDNLIKQYLVLRCYKKRNTIYENPCKAVVYFPITDDGMSIELYFQNISDNTFVDEDFYKQRGIDRVKLKLLGVKDDISIGSNDINGEYYTGNSGRQPYWNTYGDFRWKLSLIRLNEVLEYISQHPEKPDSMAKSNFIYRFLQKNESCLTGTVHIGGSTHDIDNAVSTIVSTLKHEEKFHYGSNWNGKWLYTNNNKLVSQKDISKHDLNTQLYGNILYNSQLYTILDFKRNDADMLEDATKDYDRIPEATREKYFEIEFQRRFGISVSEGKELLDEKISTTQISELPAGDTFDFPSSKVKSWESLRKHVAQVLCYSDPVKYEYKVHSIRVSRPSSEIKAYLINMYKIEGKNKCACQMCHGAFSNVEMCQFSNDPEVELDAMNLCLCPNCAGKYRKIRADKNKMNYFIRCVKKLDDYKINHEDPVKINIERESIWFTQSHIAEIKELMRLQDAVDGYEKQKQITTESIQPNLSEKTGQKIEDKKLKKASTDVYKEYVGKTVYHRGYEAIGTVISCDGKYIMIKFDNGPKAGETRKFSLEMILKKGLIHIVTTQNNFPQVRTYEGRLKEVTKHNVKNKYLKIEVKGIYRYIPAAYDASENVIYINLDYAKKYREIILAKDYKITDYYDE